MQDPQSAPGNRCPLNLFGLEDCQLLQPIETAAVYQRGREMELGGLIGKFDLGHLKSIHGYLFQDVFPWAGKFRVVNISKGNSSFGPVAHIVSALVDALDKLKREDFVKGLQAPRFAERAAFYLGEINAIHPFREGNGRTQREFIRQLAVQAGYPLSWAGFTQEQMTLASIRNHLHGDNSALAAIIEGALLCNRAES